jgi:hypothetical protein
VRREIGARHKTKSARTAVIGGAMKVKNQIAAIATTMLALLVIFGFAQAGLAQTTTNPLSFSKNYILSGGDYLVGSVGLRGAGDSSGFATGRISIPDSVQAQALNVGSLPRVPDAANIVAAFLYWETVEKSQSAFAGQNGFFGPVNFNSDGTVSSVSSHPITGTVLGNGNAPPSWSSGGCAGSSNGTTTLRTYRADVRPFLPLDANGNILANGTYQVSLADSGSNGGGAPLTLGASLVLVYRVLGPLGTPPNAIIIYDGAFAPSNQTANSTMTQPMQGFYQPDSSHVAKITHIVGDGQVNKSEQVSFNGNSLSSLYPNTPPFPGVYNSNGQLFNGSWDSPTWNVGLYVNGSDTSATTSVTPGATTSSSGGGCVDWGVIIFSTTVQSSDNDSLLDVWKTKGGYCDAAVNEGVCSVGDNSWVPLPGAATPGSGIRDLYVQVDHFDTDDFMSSGGTLGHSHKLKQAALDMVGDALKSHSIKLHVDCNNCYPGDQYVISSARGGDVIPESSATCQDQPNATPPAYCEFPGVAVTRWKGDFTLLKNQPLNYPDELSCETQTPPGGSPGTGPTCVRRFQHGRKDSYHEVIFGHAFGLAANSWFVADGTLTSISVDGSSNTATVTTPSPHGLSSGARVTVSGAILTVSGTPSLSGAFSQAFALNGNYPSITVTSPTTFTFPVTNVPAGTYNNQTLFVATGPPLSISGWSDLPGAHSLITFGLWRSDNPADDQVGGVLTQAGTFAHELGHTLGFLHGGGDAINCKPNYQSVMSYQFQVRGLPGFDGFAHVDYSNQVLPLLDETNLTESAGLGFSNGAPLATTYRTRWFAPPNFLYNQLNTVVGTTANAPIHCDGTPITDGAKMVRLEGPLVAGPIDWNNNGNIADFGFAQDSNFNDNFFNPAVGNADAPFAGFNDWANIDLRQIGGAPGVFGYSGDTWGRFDNSGPGGTGKLGAGASATGGMTGAGDGGTGKLGAGTGKLGAGTGKLGAGAEADFDLSNSTVDPPSVVGANQVSHTVVLTWTPPGFGRIRTYYIWRANTTNGPISPTNLPVNVGKVTGTPPATKFIDNNNVKTKTTYTYFVTSALGADSGKNNGNQSGPSNMVTIKVVF